MHGVEWGKIWRLLQKITYHYYEKYFQKLCEISNLKKYKSLFSIIVVVLICYDKKFLISQKNEFVNIVIDRIKQVYQIDLTEEEIGTLVYLFLVSQYKFLFSIKFSINYYICDSDIPKSILKGLFFIFSKNNINLLLEDQYTLALFIYQVVCKNYEKKKFKFLICDSNFSGWKGIGFKNELLKYLPSSQIEITSNSLIQKFDFKDFNYVIFIDYIVHRGFFKYENVIFLKYKDFFSVNSFWGHLFFGKGNNYLK